MTTLWLIEQSSGRELEQARASRTLNAGEIEAFTRMDSAPSTALKVAGDVGQIDVVGVLGPRRDRMAWLLGYGATAYIDIINALAEAEANPAIKKIVLAVDSPGGMVAGLFECLDALAAAKKPITARCGLAASAAYAIAAAADRVEATGRASSFGSIGVATSFAYWNDQTILEITNTDSPDKRPDPRTPAGKAVVVKQLDDIAALFVDAIARGRKVSAATVKANFGRGGMLLASAAKQAGMIDAIAGGGVRSSGSRASTQGYDMGDALVELDKAKKERREPAAWVWSVGATDTPSLAIDQGVDDGDLLMAHDLARDRRLHKAPTAPAAENTPPLAAAAKTTPLAAAQPPEDYDVSDQLVEIDNARSAGRAPAAWATTPIDTTRRLAAKKVKAFRETVAAAQENREPASWARALWP